MVSHKAERDRMTAKVIPLVAWSACRPCNISRRLLVIIFSATHEAEKINKAHLMTPAILVKDERGVAARLRELFDVSLEDAIHIVLAAAGAKADAVDDDPLTAPGTFAYIYGTRAVRQTFRSRGWQLDRRDGVESVVNLERGLKLVFQNADLAASEHQDPKAVSEKGNASERAVRLAQGWLFPEMEREEVRRETAHLWFLFASIDGPDIRAELSRPRAIAEGQFVGFHERIFILKRGDLDKLSIGFDDEGPIDVPEVIVSKK